MLLNGLATTSGYMVDPLIYYIWSNKRFSLNCQAMARLLLELFDLFHQPKNMKGGM